MAILCLGCLVIQLLPIISVPITGSRIGYSIYLSYYQNYKFGVFGLCDMTKNICSDAKIGYPSKSDPFYDAVSDSYEKQFGGVELPSKARYTISKLLVVHVVSFCLSGCLMSIIIFLLVIYSYDSTTKIRMVDKFRPWPKRRIRLRDGGSAQPIKASDRDQISSRTEISSMRTGSLVDLQLDEIVLNMSPTEAPSSPTAPLPQPLALPVQKPRFVKTRINVTPYLNIMLTLALLSFMSTLMGFLSDILLFIPHLSYVGWLQFYPIIAIALIMAMICFMKRSVNSRRYLDELSKQTYTDDIRIRRQIDVDDSDSDDGFYVYTNGFYSTYNNEEIHRPGTSTSLNGWRRHTPGTDHVTPSSGDQLEINHRRDTFNDNSGEEDIELRNLGYDLTHTVSL